MFSQSVNFFTRNKKPSKAMDIRPVQADIVNTQLINRNSNLAEVLVQTETTSSEQPSNCKQERLNSFEASLIFWFNDNLQRLFKEHLDLCSEITQKQISIQVNQRISTVLQSLSKESLSERNELLFNHPTQVSTDESIFNLLNRNRAANFSAILHFNIRFARFFDLSGLSLTHNPLEPIFSYNLLHDALERSIITRPKQKQLLARFAELCNESFHELVKASNLLFCDIYNVIDTSQEAYQNTTDHRSSQEAIAANGGNVAEAAMKYSTEAINSIFNASPIPNRIHPLIKEWEKYLFKLYLTKGPDSHDWSRALRTLVSIRRLTRKNNETTNKQVHFDSLADALAECKKGLAYNLINQNECEALIQPLEEICVMAVYNETLSDEAYSHYSAECSHY